MGSRLDRITDWEEWARRAKYRAPRLAKALETTSRHLRRYCAQQFGHSTQAWLNLLRLRESRRLLAQGQQVSSVAYELDFKQVSHFCTAFKRAYGMTPASFSVSAIRQCPPQITEVRRR